MSKSATLPPVRSKARPAKLRSKLVEHELDRARTRIRTIDMLSALAQLAAGMLAYVLIVITVDYWLRMSDLARQILWITAGTGAAAFVLLRIVRPLIQRINPYYAARVIEKATPESKNGIVNWLDLHDQPINPIIREALSRRAVHELDTADMERAIPTKKPVQFALIVGFIVLGIIVVAWFLPDQAGSLFKRALFPFQQVIIPTKTRLEVLSPIKEPVPEVDLETLPAVDVPVERGQPVEFRVQAHGVPPAEVFFESQAAGDRAPISKPMRQDRKDDPASPWRVALSSSDIPVDGLMFWFRANDGLTRKFRLVVTSRIPPAVSDLNVVLSYPNYTRRRPTQQGMGPIKAIVGTEVQLEVAADRPVELGDLTIYEETPLAEGRRVRRNVETFRLVPVPTGEENKLILEKPLGLKAGLIPKHEDQKFYYELSLKSRSGLFGTSPSYPLEVEPDLTPWVEIHKVKDTVLAKDQEDLEVEANAVVPIAGKAGDDVAIGQVGLRLKYHLDGRELYYIGPPPMEKNLQKATGFRPPPVDYLLTLDLTKLTFDAPEPKDAAPNQEPAKLRPGTVLELVVEARDTADPEAHVGTSRLLKLKLKGEASNQERQEQQKQANQQQQRHDQQKQERQQRDVSQQKDQNEKDQDQKNNQNEKGEGQPQDNQSQDAKSGQGEEKPKDPNAPKDKQPQSGEQQNQGQKNSNEKTQSKNNKGEPSDQKSTNKEGGASGDKKPDVKNQPDTKNQKGEKGNTQPQSKDGASNDGNKGQPDEAKENQGGKPDPNQKNSGTDNKTGERNKTGNESTGNRDPNQKPNDAKNPDGTKQSPQDAKSQPKPGEQQSQQGNDGQRQKGKNEGEKNKTEGDQGQSGDQKNADQRPGDNKGEKTNHSNETKQGNDPSQKTDASDRKSGKEAGKQEGDQSKQGDQNRGGNKSDQKPGEKAEDSKKQSNPAAKEPSQEQQRQEPGDQKKDQTGDQKKEGAGKDASKQEKGQSKSKAGGEPKPGEQSKPGDEKPKDGVGDKGEKHEKQEPSQGEQGNQNRQPGEKQEGKEGNKSQGNDQKGGEEKPGEQSQQPGQGQKQGEKKEVDAPKPGDGEKKPGEAGSQGEKKESEKGTQGKKSGQEQGKQGDQQSEQSGKQPGQKGEAGQKQDTQDRQSGAKEPGDQGKLDDLLKQAHGDTKKEGTKFDPNQAGNLPGDKNKPQEIDAEAAKKKNLAIDTLLDKLRKGDIDKNLGDALKRQSLTKEEAIKLLENNKLDRQRAQGPGTTIGPSKSLTTVKRGTEQIIDPSQDVPDELSSSYRTFTQKRNQAQSPKQPR